LHHHRLLLVESVAVDPLADVVAGLPDDLAALQLPRGIDLGGGVAPGEERLLLHDRGSRLPHDQAKHGIARDYADSGSYTIPDSATDATANASPCAGAASAGASAAATGADPALCTTSTSRPGGSVQLRG